MKRREITISKFSSVFFHYDSWIFERTPRLRSQLHFIGPQQAESLSSSLHSLLLFIPSIVKNIRSTAEYFADRLFKAMKVSSGPGALLNYCHTPCIAPWKAEKTPVC